jgi:hypothetical protein
LKAAGGILIIFLCAAPPAVVAHVCCVSLFSFLFQAKTPKDIQPLHLVNLALLGEIFC